MKNILLYFTILLPHLVNSQVIWVEDFSPYPNGTQNAVKWTTNANNCDADGPPGTVADNYWGTFNGEFRCEDIEGLTCCSGGQGEADNLWLSEDISIVGYTKIYISMSTRVQGNVECAACGSGGDLLEASYQIDGGPWIPFITICGAASGFFSTDCIYVGTGNILKIRVLLGNQANDEVYYFDDVTVYTTQSNVIYHN
jgi:hypothetical protein